MSGDQCGVRMTIESGTSDLQQVATRNRQLTREGPTSVSKSGEGDIKKTGFGQFCFPGHHSPGEGLSGPNELHEAFRKARTAA